MLTEISRILVSLLLLGMATFLYACGLHAPEAAMQLGMTNTASVIVGANLTYWLKAEPARK
jgi:multisubunit Na+/H+ antiporter MnhB subunit